jgi:phosphomannomutase
LKADEVEISAQMVALPAIFDEQGNLLPTHQPPTLPVNTAAERQYVTRFIQAFPLGMLAGKRILVYEHSAVARRQLCEVMRVLGGEVISVGASDTFVPLDTEAIRPTDVELAARWAREYAPFAIVSTDGDSDRPLVADERGEWLRGDILGIICAQFVHADAVVTPVTSNTAVEKCGRFPVVVRTRIGSPYVIEEMLRLVASGKHRVVGYEANGGFLTASPLKAPCADLSPLPTRDAMIPILSVLAMAVESGSGIHQLLQTLPARYTASDRLVEFPTDRSAAIMQELTAKDPMELEDVFRPSFGNLTSVDWTDGLRMTFASREIAHVRPSGNAPEFRCYAEADTEERAHQVMRSLMQLLASWRQCR